MYAKLTAEQLKNDVFSMDDIKVLITSKVPNDFAGMYTRIFRQYQEHQHKYIRYATPTPFLSSDVHSAGCKYVNISPHSLLFSLIAYARRPLHLHELREAMTLALSDSPTELDPLKAPMNLPRLFAPLIEMQTDTDTGDPENALCRLCHATVREFLTANPDVLHADGSSTSQVPFTYTISPSKVGDLCLRYLCQQRYSVLLQPPRENYHEVLSLAYDSDRQQGLLPYCAKYWDRHLEDLKPTPRLRREVFDFLGSPNFQTMLQMQSMFVTRQFARFGTTSSASSIVSRAVHRRVFPTWFGLDSTMNVTDPEYQAKCQKYRRDYQHFVNEWGYLLERGTCVSSEPKACLVEHFWGEVDRCLSGLLGPTSFLNRMNERYPSFMLTRSSFNYHKTEDYFIAEAVSSSSSQFMVISSPSRYVYLTFNWPDTSDHDNIVAKKVAQDRRKDSGGLGHRSFEEA